MEPVYRPLAMILTAIVSLPLLFVIPGFLTFSLFTASSKRKKWDIAEGLFIAFLSSILISSWLGLLLAQLGCFSLWLLLIILSLISISTICLLKFKVGFWPIKFCPVERWTVLLCLVLIVAAIANSIPSENIVGEHDVRTRFSSAAHLSKTGSIAIHDPEITDTLGQEDLQRFTGIFVIDPQRGILTSQFNSLYEVWGAIFYAIFGMNIELNPVALLGQLGLVQHFSEVPIILYLTPLFGLLSIVALYFLGHAVFSDPRISLLACFLLSINVAQILFSRLSLSEVMAQFFIISGMYAFATYSKENERYLGLLAGACFGMAILTRIDTLLLFILVLVLMLYLIAISKFKRSHLWFFAPALLLVVHFFVHHALFPEYIISNLSALPPVSISIVSFVLLAAIMSSVIFSIFLRHNSLKRRFTLISSHAQGIKFAFGILVVVAALYAYFLRPILYQSEPVYVANLQQTITFHNEDNLVRLGWYISPLTIFLAVAGLFIIIVKRIELGTAFFLGAFVLYTTFFIHDAHIRPHHYWWVRRFIPVVIPSMMLMASYAVFHTRELIPWRRFGSIIAGTLVIVLVVSFVKTDIALASNREYAGAVTMVRNLARVIPEDSVAIFESFELGAWFAMPLDFVYNRSSFVLQSWQPDNDRIFNIISHWQAEGKEVYYIADTGQTTLQSKIHSFLPVAEAKGVIRALEETFDRLPTNVKVYGFDLEVYKISPARSEQPVPVYPFRLDIGSFDYGYLVGGFHRKEWTTTETCRFTKGEATLKIPWQPKGDEVMFTFNLAGKRLFGVEPAKVSAYINGTEIGGFSLENKAEWHPFEFEVFRMVVPASLVDNPEEGHILLRLETNPWVPASKGYKDVRELGILIDWIQVEDVNQS